MAIAAASSRFYKVGGSLGFDHPSYVTRKADHELLQALSDRQFCYVFNCRQMGKSSLRVRAMHLLQQQGMQCASIDMTMLGSLLKPQQWYGGIMTQLFQGFSLFGQVNLKTWLQAQQHLSPVQQLSQFMTEVLLPQTGHCPLFIFIDEIDKILSLEFSVDDFFALIRFFYNQRAENSDFNRLTFALFGVATPSDLIQDKTQTLFNIGYAIELKGFSLDDVQPLAMGLKPCCDRPIAVMQAILHWTGGQPFLTQKLCQLVIQTQQWIPAGEEAPQIEQLVRSQILTHWEVQDEPVHFKTIQDRVLRRSSNLAGQLGLYRQLLRQETHSVDVGLAQTELRLSGLVVQREGQLQIYNPIYAEIFNLTWIEQQLAHIRPYAEAIAAWETSQRQDDSRLLRGKALREALAWAESKSLSQEDYQFLAASQNVDKQTALEQERRRQDVERLEMELAAEQKAKDELAFAYAKAKKRLRAASIILVASVIGAVIATGWLGYVLRRQQETQVDSLEWAGKGALSQFDFSQIDALLTAMEAAQQLQSFVKQHQPLQDYPTASPINALQTILDQIHERNALVGHDAPINGISISSNGQLIATASRDGTAKIWAIDGTELRTLTQHQGDVYGVSFSPDNQRLATSAKDGNVNLWSIQGKLLKTLKHPSDVYSVRFSPDGQWIVTASEDGNARLWTQSGDWIRTLQGHQQPVYNAEFSSDSRQIVTASRDGTAKIWQWDGTLVRSLPSQDALYSASFSPDGKRVATVGQAGMVQIWQGERLEQTLTGHQGAIYDVSFDPRGNFLVTSSADETVKIWTVAGEPVLTLQGYQGAVYEASFSKQGDKLVTASHEKEAKLWDFSRVSLAEYRSQPSEAAALRMNSEGDRVIAFVDGRVRIEDPSAQLKTQFQTEASIYDLSLTPDQHLITAFADGQVEIRNPQGKRIQKFRAHEDTIYSVTVHPSQRLFATGARDKTVKLWNFEGQLQKTLTAHQDAVYDVQFSPDGQWIATSSSDKTAKIWSSTGELQATLEGHRGAIHQIVFSPDSRRLATASTDETARLWDLTGQEQQVMVHHSGLVFRVGFSPEGNAIATGSKDGTVSLWDLEGRLLDQFKGHQSLVMDVLFTGHQQLITIDQADAQTRVWPLSVSQRLQSLLDRGCHWLQNYFNHYPQRQPKACLPGAKH